MARCAACRSELVNGRDQFRYIDEFIVHLRCVGIPIRIRSELAEQTDLVAKLQTSARNLAALLEQAEASERTTRIAHSHVAKELGDTRADLAAEKSLRTSLEFQLELARARGHAPALPTPDEQSKGSPPPNEKPDLEQRVNLLELT